VSGPHNLRGPVAASGRTLGLDQKTELGERGNTVVEPDFLDDLLVLQAKNRCTGEMHLAARIGRERSHQEIAEGRSGMSAAAFPLTDDIIAFRNEVGRAPEIQIGKGIAEIGHERLDTCMTAARLMEGILQQHVRRGDLVDDLEIAGLPPEMGKPGPNDVLVVFLLIAGEVWTSEQLFFSYCRHAHILDGFA